MFEEARWMRNGIAVFTAMVVMLQAAGVQGAVPPGGGVLRVEMGEGPSPVSVKTAPQKIAPGVSFRTGPKEALELLLPDGTSLLLGGSSEITVERFVESAGTAGGAVTIRLSGGRLRVAGGSISRGGTLEVLTADSRVTIENASAGIVLIPGGTRVSFLSGDAVRVVTGGKSEVLLSRPGFEVASSGGTLSNPARTSREVLMGDASEFNPGLKGNLAKPGDSGRGGGETEQTITLASRARDEGTFQLPLPTGVSNPGGGSSSPPDTLPVPAGPIPPAPPAPPDPFAPPSRPGAIDQALGDGSGFGPGTNLGVPNVGGDQGSVSASLSRNITQNRIPIAVPNPDPATIPPDDTLRLPGPTTNRLFKTTGLLTGDFPGSSVVIASDGSFAARNPNRNTPGANLNLEYVFLATPSALAIAAVGDEAGVDWLGANGTIDAPFLLRLNRAEGTPSLRLGLDGRFSDPYFDTPVIEPPGTNDQRGSILDRVTEDDLGQITRIDGTVYKLLQAGFVTATAGNPTGSRAADNFFFLEARPAEAQLDPFGVPTGAFDFRSDRPERFIFAAGDVDGTPNTAFAVHHFFLSAGSEGYGQKSPARAVASGIRAFLRNETALGLTLADTGVLVAGRGAGSIGNEQNALLHADFALAGSGATQRSTISLTIGNVNYITQTDGSRDAIVEGRTVGSSHDNTRRSEGKAEGATLLTSPLFSTAAGGGNPDVRMSGRAGYLVLENFNPAAAVSDDNAGGEAPLNGPEVNYAMLRLATATGTSSIQGGRTSDGLNGYVAGLVEVQTGSGIGIAQLDSGDTAQGLTLQTDAANNRVAASASLITTGAAQSITLGGLTGEESKGESAFIDNDRFAARDAGGNVALVNGELVRAGLPAEVQAQIANYQHLQWGFFFGDVVATPGSREHAHLSTWIAGKVPNAGDLPTSGTATYGGHAIGNVYNNGSLYTAVGSYQNSWDFGKRQGSVTMNFDNATYSGTTVLTNGTADFSGRVDSTNRVGGVFGTFVQGGSDPAAAQMGRFSINETSGDPYRASGTFGAEKKP